MWNGFNYWSGFHAECKRFYRNIFFCTVLFLAVLLYDMSKFIPIAPLYLVIPRKTTLRLDSFETCPFCSQCIIKIMKWEFKTCRWESIKRGGKSLKFWHVKLQSGCLLVCPATIWHSFSRKNSPKNYCLRRTS